jgi:hypothetical protein
VNDDDDRSDFDPEEYAEEMQWLDDDVRDAIEAEDAQ